MSVKTGVPNEKDFIHNHSETCPHRVPYVGPGKTRPW